MKETRDVLSAFKHNDKHRTTLSILAYIDPKERGIAFNLGKIKMLICTNFTITDRVVFQIIRLFAY